MCIYICDYTSPSDCKVVVSVVVRLCTYVCVTCKRKTEIVRPTFGNGPKGRKTFFDEKGDQSHVCKYLSGAFTTNTDECYHQTPGTRALAHLILNMALPMPSEEEVQAAGEGEGESEG